MRLRIALCASFLATAGLAPRPAHAESGKLAEARRQVAASERSSSDDNESSGRGRRHHRHGSCEDEGLVEQLICGLLGCSCDDAGGAIELVSETEEPEEPPLTYASYPYASRHSPYMLEPDLLVASTSAELDAQLHSEHAVGRPWAGQLMLDAGYMSGIGRSSLDARVLTPSPFELEARNTLLYEPAARDYSIFGAALLGLRFASLHAVLMHVYAGPTHFGLLGEMHVGAELGGGMDVFLGRPWVLSARTSVAMFGENLFAPQTRVQLGYLFGRSEVFVGYEYVQIGSVGLSTPLLGTRLWL
jgi:hypothetical protein